MKLYIAAVQLSRVTPLPGGGGYTSTHTMTLHYRRGVSEGEMSPVGGCGGFGLILANTFVLLI